MICNQCKGFLEIALGVNFRHVGRGLDRHNRHYKKSLNVSMNEKYPIRGNFGRVRLLIAIMRVDLKFLEF